MNPEHHNGATLVRWFEGLEARARCSALSVSNLSKFYVRCLPRAGKVTCGSCRAEPISGKADHVARLRRAEKASVIVAAFLAVGRSSSVARSRRPAVLPMIGDRDRPLDPELTSDGQLRQLDRPVVNLQNLPFSSGHIIVEITHSALRVAEQIHGAQ